MWRRGRGDEAIWEDRRASATPQTCLSGRQARKDSTA